MTEPARNDFRSASASQLGTYHLCRRRWFINRILGVSEPESDQMAVGTYTHGHMEGHYLEGTTPTVTPEAEEKWGELVKNAIASARLLLQNDRLPPRDAALLIETPKDYGLGLSAHGIPIRGRIDLIDPRTVKEDGHLKIWDWKTKGSLRYVKDTDELERDVQLNIYAAYGFVKFGATSVSLYHGNIGTRSVTASISETRPLTRPQVEDVWSSTIIPTIGEMKVVATAPSAADVEPTTSACYAFNKPCPFLVDGSCKISPFAAVRRGLDGTTDSPTPQPHTQEGDTTMPEMNLQEALRARARRAEGVNPPDAAKPEVVEPYVPPTSPPLTEADGVGVNSVVAGSSTPAPIAAVTTASTLALYVDCVPTKGASSTTNLADEIARRTPAVLDALRRKPKSAVPPDAVDVRQVPYGEGVAELAASFRREPLTGVVLASSHGAGGAVLEVLEATADVVVKGSR